SSDTVTAAAAVYTLSLHDALPICDALQALAFELVAEAQANPAALIALSRGLARAAGVRGMVGGQALDIAAETAATPLNLDEITQDRKSTRLNSSHVKISYAVFCVK